MATLRLTHPPQSKRETWTYAYCEGVFRRWVEAEIAAGTVNAIPGYKWLDWPEGIPKPDEEEP